MRLTVSVNKLLDTARLVLLGLLLFYILCFQYAFQQINGALPVLGILLLGLEALRFRCLSDYKNIVYVLLFVLLSMILGLMFALNVNRHRSQAVDMMQLCIPMICICGYVGRSEARFRQILHIISISVLILAIMLFFKGEQFTYYGSVTLGDLNTNTFSSFLLLGLLAQLFLISGGTKPLIKWLLMAAIVAELIAQLQLASRRGVVIFAFMLVTYLHTVIFIRYKNKPIYKMAAIFLVACVVVALLANFTELSEKFVVFRRFQGEYTVGDEKRAIYQRVAWELFLEKPIAGQGFAAVSCVVGTYSHSMFYEVLACTGVIGAIILFLPMVAVTLWFGKQSMTVQGMEEKLRLRTMFWGIVAILLSGVAVVFIYDAIFYLLLAFIAVTCNVYLQKTGKAITSNEDQ